MLGGCNMTNHAKPDIDLHPKGEPATHGVQICTPKKKAPEGAFLHYLVGAS